MIFLSITMALYIFVWALLAFFNIRRADKKCDEASVKNREWYIWSSPHSVSEIFNYYSPFSWKNLFGLRFLFIPFKIPEGDK